MMWKVLIIILIILIILVIILVALYYFGNKMQKKQAENQHDRDLNDEEQEVVAQGLEERQVLEHLHSACLMDYFDGNVDLDGRLTHMLFLRSALRETLFKRTSPAILCMKRSLLE